MKSAIEEQNPAHLKGFDWTELIGRMGQSEPATSTRALHSSLGSPIPASSRDRNPSRNLDRQIPKGLMLHLLFHIGDKSVQKPIGGQDG